MALNLQAFVGLDSSGFENGIKRVEGAAHRAGETVKGLALSAIGIYSIEAAISHTIETADKLVDTSRRLGVSLDALQKLGYAAKVSGGDIDELTSFIERLNTARINPKKIESFAKLGISEPDLKNLKAEDLILKLSANVRNRSSQEVIGPLRDIGGKGAGQLLVMLKENLEELGIEAQKVGAVIGDQDLVALKYLREEMQIMAMVATAQLAPALTYLMNIMIQMVNKAKAAGTFWGSLSGSTKKEDWIGLLDAALTPGGGLQKFKSSEAGQRLRKAFDQAGAQSDAVLSELEDNSDAMFKRLLARQKEIEAINSMPDFNRVTSGGTDENKGVKTYSDQLLAVGNFLGSGSNPMVSIGQTQTNLLKKIEENTRPQSSSFDDDFPP